MHEKLSVTDSEIFNVDNPAVIARIEAELEIKDCVDVVVVSNNSKAKISDSSLKISQGRCVVVCDEAEAVADNVTISIEVFADIDLFIIGKAIEAVDWSSVQVRFGSSLEIENVILRKNLRIKELRSTNIFDCLLNEKIN